MGKSIEEVAKEYNSSTRNIQYIMKKYYPKELITPEKRRLIEYYGCIMKVPVDYLAPYVYCSRKACANIIKECEEACDIKNLKVLLAKKIEKFLKDYWKNENVLYII